MALVKPQSPPGFLSQATQVQARGGWFTGNLVRWRTGLLEKIGGWRKLIDDTFPAIIRRMHGWLDLENRKNLMIAGDDGVRLLVQDTLYELGSATRFPGGFIPEIGAVGELTKFTVALNSTEVKVTTAIPVTIGKTFAVLIGISIGGRIITAGSFFTVKAVVSGGFTADMPMPALVAEADTYGIPLLTNDIVNGFTVTWKAHGLTTGTIFRFPASTSIKLGTTSGNWDKVKFSAIAGTARTVATVPDADHFTFLMGDSGTGDGTGGVSHQVYAGGMVEHPLDGGITGTVGSVLGFANAIPLGNPQNSAWFLANHGERGLVVASGGPLQVYQPPIESGPFLTIVGPGTPTSPPTSPQHNNGMIVAMPQGQVILWGTDSDMEEGVADPLLVRWSHAGTYDVWSATVSNQAGSARLYRGSRIVGAIQAPQAVLLLTDTDMWQMTYIGPPLVYGFTIMGSGCGLVAPHAIGVLGRTTMWQGQKNFWMYDTAVQPVPCTVWDYVFTDVDPVNINKCHAAPNSTTNELAFYFASQKTMINVDRNLLAFSQLFSDPLRWVQIGVTPLGFSRIVKTFYLYEPQYKIAGWWDDAGFALLSWWDDDVREDVQGFIYAPDGTQTSMLLIESATDGMHSVSQKINKAGERITYTLSVYAHDSSTRNLTLRAVSGLGSAYATFDVTTGNVVAAGVTSAKFALIEAQVLTDALGTGRDHPDTANGWRRYVMSFTSDDSPTLELFFNITNGTQISYLGTPPKGVLIWGAQLVLGPDPLDYQQTGGIQRQNETRRYVKVNTAEGMAWDSGRLSRSAWLDESVWGTPLGADTTLERTTTGPTPLTVSRNVIEQHEIGYDDDLEPMENVFVETGFTELGDGTAVMLVDQVHPDLKWFGRDGAVDLSLRATNYPQGPQHLYGPFPMTPGTQWFNPRVRARYVAVRYDWAAKLGYSARVGLTTFHVKPAGKWP